MKTQRNHATVGLGRVALLALLAVVILGAGRGTRVSRELPRTLATQTAPTAAGTDIFITFDGMPAKSKDKEHAGWSDALSFSQGLTQMPVPGRRNGGRRGCGALAKRSCDQAAR